MEMDSKRKKAMINALDTIKELFNYFEKSPIYLPEDEFKKLKTLVEVYLGGD